MIIKQNGGMTEFIPSPGEKREALIRNHVFELLANLHERMLIFEDLTHLPCSKAEAFARLFAQIEAEEERVRHTHLHARE